MQTITVIAISVVRQCEGTRQFGGGTRDPCITVSSILDVSAPLQPLPEECFSDGYIEFCRGGGGYPRIISVSSDSRTPR